MDLCLSIAILQYYIFCTLIDLKPSLDQHELICQGFLLEIIWSRYVPYNFIQWMQVSAKGIKSCKHSMAFCNSNKIYPQE